MAKAKNSRIIVKSNELVQASYRLTAGEQKIILQLVSVIKPEDADFKKYSFNVKEFAQLIGTNHKDMYNQIKTSTRELMKKVFTIKTEKSTLQLAWLSSAEYIEGEGIVELEFSPKLKPYLLQLKSKFTIYKLQHAVKLRSFYAIRIYELLKQYQGIGRKVFTIDYLRDMFQIEPDEYKLYGDFKRKVILQAQREINSKTDISFSFEEIKTGRKVTDLKFTIVQQQVENEIAASIQSIRQESGQIVQGVYDEVQGLIGEDITALQVKQILDAAGGNIEVIKEKYEIISLMNVRSLVGALITAIREDWKPVKGKNRRNKFTDYDQRVYDIKDLEKKLLGLAE